MSLLCSNHFALWTTAQQSSIVLWILLLMVDAVGLKSLQEMHLHCIEHGKVQEIMYKFDNCFLIMSLGLPTIC